MLEEYVNSILAKFGVKLQRRHAFRDPIDIMIFKSTLLGVKTILDIGANTGQYASELRRHGWEGQIVSFEPLPTAYNSLMAQSQSDPKWECAPRLALGSAAGTTNINIAINSVSSSLLSANSEFVKAAPDSVHVATEEIKVATLDSLIQPHWATPVAMKVDTQGYDKEVLLGAVKTLADTLVVQVEVSLAPVYQNGATPADIFQFLAEHGFRAISVCDCFSDLRNQEALQVDVTFIRVS
jgi:FkbM family methyltransferase